MLGPTRVLLKVVTLWRCISGMAETQHSTAEYCRQGSTLMQAAAQPNWNT